MAKKTNLQIKYKWNYKISKIQSNTFILMWQMMLLCWNQIDACNTNIVKTIEIHCIRQIMEENETHLFQEYLKRV